MKLFVVILGGAGDRAVGDLGGRTPLAVARMPALQGLAATGRLGAFRPFPGKAPRRLETALASLLSRDDELPIPDAGGLAASALGVSLEPGRQAWRFDFATLFDGRIADPTAGRIGAAEAAILLEALAASPAFEGVRLAPVDRWRNLAILDPLEAETVSPVEFPEEPAAEHDPRGPGADRLSALAARAEAVLAGHEINLVRADLGENPANGVWPWGGGRPTARRPGPPGRAIGVEPSFLGLARETGLTPVRVAPGVGPEDEAQAVADATLAAASECDFVIAFYEAPLLAGWLGDAAGKVAALEAADRHLIRPLAERVSSPGVRLVVAASHAVATERRRDVADPAPFVVAGEGVVRYGDAPFTEEAAAGADLAVDRGRDLFEYASRA